MLVNRHHVASFDSLHYRTHCYFGARGYLPTTRLRRGCSRLALNVVAMSEGISERNNDALSDLFADGSWQRGNCKQLQTSDGMLLFQNWQQTADDQWKLWPITVVIGRGMSGVKSAAPVIIESAEGADITFTESLDVMSGGAPPIRQGRMIGSVHIHRSSVDDQHSLDIRTANVRIDNKKIWTTDKIEMRVGQAQMVGRDLTIHLAGRTSPGGGAAVLERMELIYLDKLMMPLEKGRALEVRLHLNRLGSRRPRLVRTRR